jgi:hypothetical protein
MSFINTRIGYKAVVNAPKTCYGCAILSYQVHNNSALTQSSVLSDIESESQILSFNTTTPVEGEIPYACPTPFIDLHEDLEVDIPFYHSRLRLTILNQLRTVTGTPPAEITVTLFMWFVNPLVSGFTENDLVARYFNKVRVEERRNKNKRLVEMIVPPQPSRRFKAQSGQLAAMMASMNTEGMKDDESGSKWERNFEVKDVEMQIANTYDDYKEDDAKAIPPEPDLSKMTKKSATLGVGGSTRIKDDEQRKVSGGKMDKFLSGVDYVVTPLTEIPIVGNAVKPFVGAFRSLKRLARVFGWDMPYDLSKNTRVEQNSTRPPSYMYGADPSVLLSCDPMNKVDNDPGLLSDDREWMLFPNYMRRPSLIWSGSFDATDAPGTIIYARKVTPLMGWSSVIEGVGSATFYDKLTYVGNVAKHFALSRGSLDFILYMNSSVFHTYRIVVCFYAAHDDVPVTIDITNYDVVRAIIDGNQGEVFFRFKILMNHYKSWLRNHSSFFHTSTDHMLTDDFYGTLVIGVINRVVGPDTTADTTINANLFLMGGEDLQFACPVPQGPFEDANIVVAQHRFNTATTQSILDATVNPDTWAPANARKYDKPAKMYAQSGKTYDLRNWGSTPCASLVPGKMNIPGNVNVGERLNSWFNIYHRYTYYNDLGVAANDKQRIDNNGAAQVNGTEVPFAMFCDDFTFFRGSMKYLFRLGTTTSTNNMAMDFRLDFPFHAWNPYNVDAIPGAMNSTGYSSTNSSNFHFQLARDRPVCHVALPYYATVTASSRWWTSTTFSHDYSVAHLYCTNSESTTLTGAVYAAAGDDFRVYWPIPPAWRIYTLTEPAKKSLKSTNNNNRNLPSEISCTEYD